MSEIKRGSIEMLLGTRNAPAQVREEDDQTHDRFFGFTRGVQERSLNIEFRPADGAWFLVEYSYLVSACWIHAGEFTLFFASSHRVTVKGRRLRDLYEKLRRHRVTYIRAADEAERVPEQELFIDEVIVECPQQ